MEIALLIFLIILSSIGIVIGVANIISSRKKSKNGDNSQDVIAELETFNNNLNEVKNIINEHTTRERETLTSALINSINASNASLAPMLELYLNSFKNALDENLKNIKETLGDIRLEMRSAVADMSKSTGESLGVLKRDMQDTLSFSVKSIDSSLDKIANELKVSLKEVREDNKTQLESVRNNNEAQLQKIRETVDEKLTETLDKRIKGAFEMVNDSLSRVQQGFGEMRDLTAKVGNLNKMFNNVKTRGGWGEVALESLLDQILSPEQYHSQFRLSKKSQEAVDFAIVMPGQGEDKVYLPIDSKFPLDRYVNLVNVSEEGDAEKTEKARKELVDEIKREAKSISSKYIQIPVTTRFAIMYLPSEGLYAEIAKNTVLTTQLQNEFNVTVCGPTTITALLNSLQIGFTTLKIQKRSGEIAKALTQFQKDFAKYGNLVASIKKNAVKVVDTIEDVEKQNERISKRLAKVGGELPQDEEQMMVASALNEDEQVADED